MKTNKQKMEKWLTCAALLLTVGGTLGACRENAIDNLKPEDQAVYITNRDRSVDFTQYRTFSLPDSVVIESNDRYSPSLTTTENQFVTGVANGLTSRGFQRVSKGQPADLGVAIIRVNNRYTGVASNPYSYYSSYWGGGFGSGLGGYGYLPYTPSYYTYQVTDQYWEIQVVDLKNRPASGTATGTDKQRLNIIYDATVRGSEVTNAAAAQQAVTAIFNQSPYLRASR